jgi:hypothetical protein
LKARVVVLADAKAAQGHEIALRAGGAGGRELEVLRAPLIAHKKWVQADFELSSRDWPQGERVFAVTPPHRNH